jgi:uncharacterized membrane protein YcgQ (UPF0703/DUF1980 family)
MHFIWQLCLTTAKLKYPALIKACYSLSWDSCHTKGCARLQELSFKTCTKNMLFSLIGYENKVHKRTSVLVPSTVSHSLLNKIIFIPTLLMINLWVIPWILWLHLTQASIMSSVLKNVSTIFFTTQTHDKSQQIQPPKDCNLNQSRVLFAANFSGV